MCLSQLSAIWDSANQRYGLGIISVHSRNQDGQRLCKIWEEPSEISVGSKAPIITKYWSYIIRFHIARQYGNHIGFKGKQSRWLPLWWQMKIFVGITPPNHALL